MFEPLPSTHKAVCISSTIVNSKENPVPPKNLLKQLQEDYEKNIHTSRGGGVHNSRSKVLTVYEDFSLAQLYTTITPKDRQVLAAWLNLTSSFRLMERWWHKSCEEQFKKTYNINLWIFSSAYMGKYTVICHTHIRETPAVHSVMCLSSRLWGNSGQKTTSPCLTSYCLKHIRKRMHIYFSAAAHSLGTLPVCASSSSLLSGALRAQL